MPIRSPIALHRWIEENRHLLRPPVGAKKIFEDAETIVMAVGGPNRRTDYHIDPGEEIFYQLEGRLVLSVVDDGRFKEIEIGPGELFVLPAGMPHSPHRGPETIGLVIERRRVPGENDGVRWYCESCHGVVREVWFNMHEGGFLPMLNAAIEQWNTEPAARLCPHCGRVQPEPTEYGVDDGA